MTLEIVTFSLLLTLLTLSEVQSHSYSQNTERGESHRGYLGNPNYFDRNMGEHYMGKNQHYTGENQHYTGQNQHYMGENQHYIGENQHYMGENQHHTGENQHYTGENQHYMGENQHYMGENHISKNQCQKTSLSTIKIICRIEIPKYKKHADYGDSIKSRPSKVKYYGSTSFIYEGKNVDVSYKLYYSKRSKFSCQMHTEEPPELTKCECGKKNKEDPTRIVGGQETGVNEYPMMAGLVDSDQKVLYGGAAIITTNYVVTAAHCVENRNLSKIGILVGDHNLTTGEDTSAAKVYRIDNCIMHPKYAGFNHDIAVCKTREPIQFCDKVDLICLPFCHQCDSFTNSTVTALGWGMLEYGGPKATTLQEVKLNVIDNQECKKYFNITDCHICTYTEGKDACQMDSGGPLLWKDDKTGNLVQVGIIEAGEGCAWDKPAIYTRVGCYVDWIQCVTGEKFCKME